MKLSLLFHDFSAKYLLKDWHVYYLEIILRIPVGVKNDARICCRQIDAKPPGSCTQKEDKAVRVWSGETVNGGLSQVTTNPSINTFIGVSGYRRKSCWQIITYHITSIITSQMENTLSIFLLTLTVY